LAIGINFLLFGRAVEDSRNSPDQRKQVGPPARLDSLFGKEFLHGREPFVVVSGVKVGGQRQLFQVIQAVDLLPFLFRLCNRGQEQRREDGDDGDDDEQFDQREGPTFAMEAVALGWRASVWWIV